MDNVSELMSRCFVLGVDQSAKTYWSVCGLPVDLDAEVSIINMRHHTIQQGQIIILRTLPGELDVLVDCIDVSSERLLFLSFDFDPCVIHISKPLAGNCSCEGDQSPLLHFLCVGVGHNRGRRRSRGEAVFLLYLKYVVERLRCRRLHIWYGLNLVLVCRELSCLGIF